MIWVTPEGSDLRPGLNFYPLGDPASFGFRLRLGRFRFKCRYSTARRRWFVETTIVPRWEDLPGWFRETISRY
jgi:hypothetical protein